MKSYIVYYYLVFPYLRQHKMSALSYSLCKKEFTLKTHISLKNILKITKNIT